jgi:PadR family transcriptional regulator, regulatory protein PadR
MSDQIDLLQGTLDLLILKALALGPMHGYGVSVRLQQLSQDSLQVQQGSLYPALHRLEQQGWIGSEWGISDNNRKAKFYSLTAAGSKQLEREKANWKKVSAAIGLVLGAQEV